MVRLRDVLFRVQGRVEEGVDEGRLAEAGFAWVKAGSQYTLGEGVGQGRADGPTTMAVKWKPGDERKRVSGGTRGCARVCVLTFAD